MTHRVPEPARTVTEAMLDHATPETVEVTAAARPPAGARCRGRTRPHLDASTQHQAVLLLLGVMIGFPGHATMVFQALRRTDARTWPQFVEQLRPQPWDDPAAEAARSRAFGALTAAQAASWRRLCETLDEVRAAVTLTDLEPFRAWLGSVGRPVLLRDGAAAHVGLVS